MQKRTKPIKPKTFTVYRSNGKNNRHRASARKSKIPSATHQLFGINAVPLDDGGFMDDQEALQEDERIHNPEDYVTVDEGDTDDARSDDGDEEPDDICARQERRYIGDQVEEVTIEEEPVFRNKPERSDKNLKQRENWNKHLHKVRGHMIHLNFNYPARCCHANCDRQSLWSCADCDIGEFPLS